MHEWQRDLSDSTFDFQRVVWPKIQLWCGADRLVPVESTAATGLAKHLDTLGGIDFFLVNDGGMRGLSARVQWDDGRRGFPYRTFTVRKVRDSGADTEYAKRLRAMDQKAGQIAPYLTCQAYVELPRRQGNLCAVAMARSDDVMKMIGLGCESLDTSNASFWVVPWDQMADYGFQIKIWPVRARQARPDAQPPPNPKAATCPICGALACIAPHESQINWGS